MKHAILYRVFTGAVLTVLLSFLPMQLRAQYLINQSYYKPVKFPTVTTKWLTKAPVGSNTFSGTAYYSDGKLTRYSGCLYFPDGSYSSCTQFTPNFQCPNGCEYMFIDAAHTTAYHMKIVNGQQVRLGTVDIKGRCFSIEGTCIKFLDNPVPSAPSVNYGSGSSTTTQPSSSYNSHKATCRGCNGSGRCQRCDGTGNRKNYANGNIENCTLCHGTGRCQSCAGLGYVHY